MVYWMKNCVSAVCGVFSAGETTGKVRGGVVSGQRGVFVLIIVENFVSNRLHFTAEPPYRQIFTRDFVFLPPQRGRKGIFGQITEKTLGYTFTVHVG